MKWGDKKLNMMLDASPVAQQEKNLPAMQETQDVIPGLGSSPGGGNGNPLQYSCLENPMERGAWQAAFHGVAKSRTLKQPSTEIMLTIFSELSYPPERREWGRFVNTCILTPSNHEMLLGKGTQLWK